MQSSRMLMTALLLTATAIGGVAAQEPADLVEQIKQLNAAAKDKKQSRDQEAQALLVAIGDSYESLESADRKKAVKAVAKVLLQGRLRDPDNTGIYRAAADALGKMESNGARAMKKVYEAKRFPNKPPWTHMRVALVINIGKTKDEKMIEFLCKCVSRSSENDVLAAAGQALGNYEDCTQNKRKEIAKEIINKWGGLEVAADQVVLARPDDPQSFVSQNAQETLEKVAPKWGPTLTKMTGETLKDGNEWQRWYNKNKRANWDAKAKPGK